MPGRRPLVTSLLLLVLAVLPGCGSAAQELPAPLQPLEFPTLKGLNYGVPRAASGAYVSTEWLREETWPEVRPAIQADLDFIQRHDLGRVVRLFIGLDQLMVWDERQGFVRFHEPSVRNFEQTLDLFDAHGIKVIAVLFDQEEVGSLGNFRFQALDGRHAQMRQNYLRAAESFLRRFGTRSTVVALDLFNEAYNSLGREGRLPKPPADNPVSPNYPTSVVHTWLKDLYRVAKQAAPQAWFTVSDTTELYWKASPDLRKYDGVLDYYDIHIYDDHPHYPDWSGVLRKPYIVGEAAASIDQDHYKDQRINPAVVRYLLEQARPTGVRAVLLQSIAEDNIFPASRQSLTATGKVLSEFGR